MKSSRSLSQIKLSMLALLAACLCATVASAQTGSSTFKGNFTLPFEAQWGEVVLPPGEYTFTLNPFVAPFTATVRGENRTAMIIAQAPSDREFRGRSELIAIRSGGRLRIRALNVADPGVVLYYGLPKAEKPVIAQAPQLLQRIPVVAAGK